MSYQVSRNGALYGPYTLEDLQRYVGTGNVLPSDLAKDVDAPETVEGVSSWIPVAQLLAASGATVPTPSGPQMGTLPSYATPSAYAAPLVPYPDPPNLNWGLVLLFGLLTCGIFTIVYDLIQTLWVKKVDPTSKALTYYIIFIAVEILNLGKTFGGIAVMSRGYRTGSSVMLSLISLVISIAIIVMFVLYRFTMRSDLLRHFNGPEPVGLRLSGVMTFFFGGLYFQYHFNRINEIKLAMRYRGTL
jgi:hypothetical protein